jgi:hypothetical protein
MGMICLLGNMDVFIVIPSDYQKERGSQAQRKEKTMRGDDKPLGVSEREGNELMFSRSGS